MDGHTKALGHLGNRITSLRNLSSGFVFELRV
jgi:hypothetical protein